MKYVLACDRLVFLCWCRNERGWPWAWPADLDQWWSINVWYWVGAITPQAITMMKWEDGDVKCTVNLLKTFCSCWAVKCRIWPWCDVRRGVIWPRIWRASWRDMTCVMPWYDRASGRGGRTLAGVFGFDKALVKGRPVILGLIDPPCLKLQAYCCIIPVGPAAICPHFAPPQYMCTLYWPKTTYNPGDEVEARTTVGLNQVWPSSRQ